MSMVRTTATGRTIALCALILGLSLAGGATAASCGPFADVSQSDPYCPAILQLYSMGITAGTSPSTFGSTEPVTRQVLALLLARTTSGATGPTASRRAALDRFWTNAMPGTLGMTTVGAGPQLCRSDGEDVWVANHDGNSVTRVHGSDGQVVNTWPGISSPSSVLTAMGQILVTGQTPGNGSLYAISPGLPGFLTLTTLLGESPMSIAFDGLKVWTANSSGSISIVTPTLPPWIVNTVSTGFSQPVGLVYDGAHIWVTDWGAGTLLKLDSSGVVIQTVTVGSQPGFATFDGSNIWVPNWGSNSVTVVHAATGEVVSILTGNGLAAPVAVAFDGFRIAVTNDTVTPFDNLSIWRAADLAPLGFGLLGDSVHPYGVCSDGIDFFVALNGPDKLARF